MYLLMYYVFKFIVLVSVIVQEEKSGEKATEAKDIKLYGQIPPIDKMDASLATLTNCEWVLQYHTCILLYYIAWYSILSIFSSINISTA